MDLGIPAVGETNLFMGKSSPLRKMFPHGKDFLVLGDFSNGFAAVGENPHAHFIYFILFYLLLFIIFLFNVYFLSIHIYIYIVFLFPPSFLFVLYLIFI